MKKILQIERDVKVRRARVNEICELPLDTMDVLFLKNTPEK
jgi:hypothetical protein